MVKPVLKSLIGAIAGATALSLLTTTTAQAAMFNFAFEVKIDHGPHIGSHRGSFQFEQSRLVSCLYSPNLLCATPTDSALSLSFNFLGNTYSEKDDFHYEAENAKFAAVYYFASRETVSQELRHLYSPYVLSLIVLSPQAEESFAILGDHFFMGFSSLADAANPARYAGRLSYFQLPDLAPEVPDDPLKPPSVRPPKPSDPPPCVTGTCSSAAVPEPTEIAGSVVAAGLLGLFWKLRRKRIALKPW